MVITSACYHNLLEGVTTAQWVSMDNVQRQHTVNQLLKPYNRYQKALVRLVSVVFSISLIVIMIALSMVMQIVIPQLIVLERIVMTLRVVVVLQYLELFLVKNMTRSALTY
jgi:hypothetical protein